MKIIVRTRAGAEVEVEGESGTSVMEAIRSHGVDELLALCGGSCSCATCHVIVDSDQAAGLPQISADEDDLLDTSEHRCAASRLSCQLTCSPVLDGLRVTIAPED